MKVIFKESDIQFGLITGVLVVAKSGMLSSLNNYKLYDIFHPEI